MKKQDKNNNITRQVYTPCILQVRESGEGESESRTICGYSILFNNRSAALWSDDGEEAYEVIASEAVTRDLLNKSDIKMTMFHDRQLILARSKEGAGTLHYNIDDKGVYFEFEAPNTVDGDKALELVRRGDISGCSFAFTTHYFDTGFVSRSVERQDNKTIIVYTVRAITGIYDFTLTPDPAYPDTSCGLRELMAPDTRDNEKMQAQVCEMRCAAAQALKY